MKWANLFLVILVVLLAACGPTATATPESSQPDGSRGEVTRTTTPAPTATQTPTPTFQPVCTPPPCAADEAYYCPGECPGGCGTTCATHTPTATPEFDLSAIHVYSIANLGDGYLLITLAGLPDLELDEISVLVEGEEYTCEKKAEYPDRAYCTGPDLPPGTEVITVVHLAGTGLIFWDETLVVPEAPAVPGQGYGDENDSGDDDEKPGGGDD